MGSRFHTVEALSWIYRGARLAGRRDNIDSCGQHPRRRWRPPAYLVSTVDRRPTLRHAMPSHGVPSIASATGPRNQTERFQASAGSDGSHYAHAGVPSACILGRNLRSKNGWFTGFYNSQHVSHFAAFFIDARAQISVVESRSIARTPWT
ncbi:hypothetical protein HPP92_007155 [Vanilla planifolia]|uniref:Uncharacterized protein n=1 Tax=Vanilla planifolia TaxID=51239 RepID=A0A835RC48_VANPL|nr:hypothetical protein HPP92_007155 [Vanilla planifolia]